MSFNQDDFLLLLLRQLEDCTSWEEELYIERTLRSNPSARQLLEDVKETFLVKEPHAYYAEDRHFFKDLEVNSPLEERSPVKVPVKKKRYFSIAATVLLIVTGASAFFLPASMQRQGPAFSDKKKVTLQLANGNVVELGSAAATISTKGAMLNTYSAMLRFTAKPGNNGWQSNSILVPPGLMYSMTLADGSTVHMNAATTVRFPFAFTGKTREVSIEGEAFFNIAPNSQQPFIVHTKKADVTVLGTAFNINTYDDKLTIGLVSGSVAVTSNQGVKTRTILTPCKAAIIPAHSNQLSTINFDSDRTLCWLRGQYRFEHQPLREVCKVAERWYDVKIKFDSEKLAQLKYHGIIHKKEPLYDFLKRLKDNGKVGEYYYDWEGVVHLNAK